jgi:aspartyl-tRNA(Asn)/glutamyl-tRNA(Gln) amidotransferase subunit A
VRNPWDLARVPGGSSGGSAAAVAARLAPAATGTDTGGSIRQPAALAGITGIKPTYGRVSRYGMIAFASSLDQAGTLTQTAEDAALLLGAMSGHDPRDSTSVDAPVPDYVAGLGESLEGLRIGLVEEFLDEGLHPEQCGRDRGRAESTRRAWRHQVRRISLPSIGLSVPTYYVVAPAECSSNLSRFDGVRFGYRAPEAARPRGPLQAQPWRGLRRRGQAPHHDGDLRAVGRLLRCLLPEGARVRQLIAADFRRAFERWT